MLIFNAFPLCAARAILCAHFHFVYTLTRYSVQVLRQSLRLSTQRKLDALDLKPHWAIGVYVFDEILNDAAEEGYLNVQRGDIVVDVSGLPWNDMRKEWRTGTAYSVAQRRTASHSVAQRRTASHSVAQRRTASHSVAQCHTASHSVAQRHTVPRRRAGVRAKMQRTFYATQAKLKASSTRRSSRSSQ
jgi:hypothetical protein